MPGQSYHTYSIHYRCKHRQAKYNWSQTKHRGFTIQSPIFFVHWSNRIMKWWTPLPHSQHFPWFVLFFMIWLVSISVFLCQRVWLHSFSLALFFTKNWIRNWSKNDFLISISPLSLWLSPYKWVEFREINSFRPLEENEGSKKLFGKKVREERPFSKVKSLWERERNNL